jgi:hypothetical protein
MTAQPILRQSEPPTGPIFPVPPVDIRIEEALNSADLVAFYEANRIEFVMLVAVMYANFLDKTVKLLPKRPKGDKLYVVFCSALKMVFTAAPPLAAYNLGISDGGNNLALQFLWLHLKRQGLTTWQDFYSETNHDARIDLLIKDFVHFLTARSFQDGACQLAADTAQLEEARRTISAINYGVKKLNKL